MLKKDNLETIVHRRPSGSVANYAQSEMEDMSSKQLSVIGRDMLFDSLTFLEKMFTIDLKAIILSLQPSFSE